MNGITPKPAERLRDRVDSYRNSLWCNLLVREMAELPRIIDDPTWFAQRTGPDIPLNDIKSSLEMLKKGRFLTYDHVKRRLIQTNKDLIANSPKYPRGKEFHTDVLKLALFSEASERTVTEDFLSMSFATNQKKREDVRKIYDVMLHDAFDMPSYSTDPNLIFQLSLQLFPLIKKI